MRAPGWVVVGILCLAASNGGGTLLSLPERPPALIRPSTTDRVVRLNVVVDGAVAAEHGQGLRELLEAAVAIHNLEWRRVRHEWFEIGEIAIEPAATVRDAIYLLTRLVHSTVQTRDTVHVRISGPLELYSNGVSGRPIGGLAFRGSDAIVVAATRGTTPELLAYYLFHEIGHCWDAFDLPFGGGHSTFGSKRFPSFDVDAGNSQIMEDSSGPRPRDTPSLAPAVIRAKIAGARRAVRDPLMFRDLHDVLLHEPSPANPAYVAKRNALLAKAGRHRGVIARLLRRYEITPHEVRQVAEARRELSEQYWIVNEAIRRGDIETAENALAAITELTVDEHRDTHLLVAAVGKKVRRVRR